jgi:putative FmdB family regulatory protein
LPNFSTVLPGRRMAMPIYEYFCEGCKKEVTRTMSISEHDKASATCPECGGRSLRPLVGTFFSQTSRKS